MFPQETTDAKSQENLAALVGCDFQVGGWCTFLEWKTGAQSQITHSEWVPEITGAEKAGSIMGQGKPRGVLRTSLLLWWCVQFRRPEHNKLSISSFPGSPKQLTI